MENDFREQYLLLFKQYGKNQTELAEELRVSRRSVNVKINGKTKVTYCDVLVLERLIEKKEQKITLKD